jgi:hypothetical protein
MICTACNDMLQNLMKFNKYNGLNILAEQLACLLHVWGVPGSNLDLITGYPD